MNNDFQFELVAPEKKLASYRVLEVEIPASEGDLTVLVKHMPLLTALCCGILRIKTIDMKTIAYVVSGGFVEISPDNVLVLADQAFLHTELTPKIIAEWIAKAEVAQKIQNLDKDSADKHLADTRALLNMR